MGGPPLLIQGHVGPASGEIHHPGDVKIDGSLLSGGQVQAGGDLHITGNVTAATAEAAGSLTVDGIVSGASTVLDAVGRVTVHHALDAKLMAGRDIMVGAAAERCLMIAGGEILLAGRPGLLCGGIARARSMVTAARIEAGGGQSARIEIGGPVFSDDPDELEERLTFARKQTVQAKVTSGASPGAYRRGLAGLRAYRRLARTLSHRLKQQHSAAETEDPPVLRVTGNRPVSGVVSMGPDQQIIDLPSQGPFEIRLTGNVPTSQLLEEAICEQ